MLKFCFWYWDIFITSTESQGATSANLILVFIFKIIYYLYNIAGI